VAGQLGTDLRVERDRRPCARPRDLRTDGLRAVVVAGELPAVQKVKLRGPMLVESVRCAEARLVIGRKLPHPRAGVVEVVLREERLEADVAREDAGVDDQSPA